MAEAWLHGWRLSFAGFIGLIACTSDAPSATSPDPAPGDSENCTTSCAPNDDGAAPGSMGVSTNTPGETINPTMLDNPGSMCPAPQTCDGSNPDGADPALRERSSVNGDWRFFKYASADQADGLIYDVRPGATGIAATSTPLAPWILPTGNDFIADPAQRHVRPEGDPGSDFPFVQGDFDDSSWQSVALPHDWAIAGPFQQGASPGVGGGMGRLPSPGVAWYRKTLEIPASDEGRLLFLDVDGAMSHAMVWLNGRLVGGWPFGYASWRIDLTPFLVMGGQNQLAIRLDNPPDSSRWYPGGGLYRNVWLTKTHPIHVAQWGTFITTTDVSAAAATIDVAVTIDNDSGADALVQAVTRIYSIDADGNRSGDALAALEPLEASVSAGQSAQLAGSVTLANPRLWGPPPTQTPNRYLAVTTLERDGVPVDAYETPFGVRDVAFDPDQGVLINGERIYLQGANQHHDLGALGAAFNVRAAERQLEILREAGCNAIRMSHNPPAPELLELTDRMGFLVMDEAFDVWVAGKPPLDFHLIFPDWHEQDLRALMRRDRNHPSVIAWSLGNEVGEQFSGEEGAQVARELHDIARAEDSTRPTTTAMNFSKPDMPLPTVPEVISLNYQGEGIRDAPAYAGLMGITTPPLYPDFHQAFPEKVILSSENAAAVSTRGTFLFPVTPENSAPSLDGSGGDPALAHVSAYELYTAPFGSSADKVFGSLERNPYVGGGFVWSGWDYLGEPTPYYQARSSYFGIIDLAGFKKDRFYLYQAHWRPDLPMVHVLPHWSWPERVGQVTPVHVFTSGDEAEPFLNGRSLGRKAKAPFEYRLRWDDVIYEAGQLRVVAYKDGQQWAEEVVQTTGNPAALAAAADREAIRADGNDLAFITVRVTDGSGLTVPRANDSISFRIEGAGEIVATDNGDPMDFTAFPSRERRAFNGLALVIVRGIAGAAGTIQLIAESGSLQSASVTVQTATAP